MKVVCFVLLIVQCSCSKSKDDLRIPSVAELNAAGNSVTNIGGLLSIGNIANIAQSNIGGIGTGGLGNIGSIGNIASVIQTNIDTTGSGSSGDDSESDGENDDEENIYGQNGNLGSPVSIGNIANIAQSNIQGSQGGIGNLATILQNNIASQGSSGSVGNIANIDQSNIGAILSILNIIGQNNNNNNNNYYNYIDEKRYIERPCQVYDIYCIRKYFAEHSKCKKSYGPVPDPKYRAQSTTYIPRLNFSVIAHDVLYGGLNGRIQEFYINKKTDNLVLTVDFTNVIFYSGNTDFKFQRRGKEPIVTNGFLYIRYESYETTTIIPNLKDLQLGKSETTSYIVNPFFGIGPSAFDYPDPSIQLAPLALLSDIGTNAQEAQITEAPFHAATFIQDSICDFGLKVL